MWHGSLCDDAIVFRARRDDPCERRYPTVNRPAVAQQILAQFHEASAATAEPPSLALDGGGPDGERLGPLFVKLSPREIEILDLVARGNSNKLIGRKLAISDQTVKNHVSAILRKLDVNDRTEAVVYALRNHYIELRKEH